MYPIDHLTICISIPEHRIVLICKAKVVLQNPMSRIALCVTLQIIPALFQTKVELSLRSIRREEEGVEARSKWQYSI